MIAQLPRASPLESRLWEWGHRCRLALILAGAATVVAAGAQVLEWIWDEGAPDVDQVKQAYCDYEQPLSAAKGNK